MTKIIQQTENYTLVPVTSDFLYKAVYEANSYLVTVDFLTALERAMVYLPDWLDTRISPHPFALPDSLKYLKDRARSSEVTEAAKRDLGIAAMLCPILKTLYSNNMFLAPDDPIMPIISGGFREAKTLLVPQHVIDKRAEYSWPKDPDAPMKAITASLKALAPS